MRHLSHRHGMHLPCLRLYNAEKFGKDGLLYNVKGKIFTVLKSNLPEIICFALLIFLLFLPNEYEKIKIYQGADRTVGRVLQTDNSKLINTGLIQTGEQRCRIKILGGRFKGSEGEAVNMLNGSLEQDKIFREGDMALIVVSYRNDEIKAVNMIDHFRLGKEILLMAIFVMLLILFAGRIGLRALMSFAVTVLIIWKVLVPGYLNGNDPVLTGLVITIILTVIVITAVYGFDCRALSATIGAILGTVMTAVLGIIFTKAFKIHGAVMPYSESLLYSGYAHLNLTRIFMAGIFIGSSGAVVDLAVDITSAVCEVVGKTPDISWRDAALSGIRVGRAALGTMTTTLLLAYSGGYVTLLMVFMAQGTPGINILNYKYVSAEILDTVVGSIGLVTVAPITSLTAAILLTRKRKK